MKQHKKQVAAMTMAVAFAVSTIATASPGLVYAQETTEESSFTDGAQGSRAVGSSDGTEKTEPAEESMEITGSSEETGVSGGNIENSENTGSTESNTGKIEQEAFSDGVTDSVGSSLNMKRAGQKMTDGTSMLDAQSGGYGSMRKTSRMRSLKSMC